MRVYFSNTNFDFPKRINDLRVAWYQKGQLCFTRNYKQYEMQVQNFQIIRINRIVKGLYQKVKKSFKADLSQYSKFYKLRYPRLRKRGMSSYAVFLMIIHAIIKRFNLMQFEENKLEEVLISLISSLSVSDFIRTGLLKKVNRYYQLNKKAIMDLTEVNKYEERVSFEGDWHYLMADNHRLVSQSPI